MVPTLSASTSLNRNAGNVCHMCRLHCLGICLMQFKEKGDGEPRLTLMILQNVLKCESSGEQNRPQVTVQAKTEIKIYEKSLWKPVSHTISEVFMTFTLSFKFLTF